MRYHVLRPKIRQSDFNPGVPLTPDPRQSRFPHSIPGRIDHLTAGLVCDWILDERDDLEVGDVLILDGGLIAALGARDWVLVPPGTLSILSDSIQE